MKNGFKTKVKRKKRNKYLKLNNYYVTITIVQRNLENTYVKSSHLNILARSQISYRIVSAYIEYISPSLVPGQGKMFSCRDKKNRQVRVGFRTWRIFNIGYYLLVVL